MTIRLNFLLTLSLAVAQAPAPAVDWSCVSTRPAMPVNVGVVWQRLNCSTTGAGVPVYGPAGPVIVNIVSADLSTPGLRLLPLAAPSALQLAPINVTAAADGRNLLAGINGGYFYRVDLDKFFDGVCIGKNLTDAQQPATAQNPNLGIGDGSTVLNGTLLSSNCNCLGFNRPAVVSINGTSTRIDLLDGTGLPPPYGLSLDSLSAGPFLLSTNASGTFIAIPSDDENILNILEHAANTGFGLNERNSTAYFVTFDGYDGCPTSNPTCGTNAFTMAYFFRDYLGVTTAMGMDQGGSTTMWVKAAGIVSSTGSTNGGPGAARPVYNGLFLLQDE